jgi:hypothetical protein
VQRFLVQYSALDSSTMQQGTYNSTSNKNRRTNCELDPPKSTNASVQALALIIGSRDNVGVEPKKNKQPRTAACVEI